MGVLDQITDSLLNLFKNDLIIYFMTDYTYCEYCKVEIPYVKDRDRYVTCPKCRQHIFVGTEKTYRKGKFRHLKK